MNLVLCKAICDGRMSVQYTKMCTFKGRHNLNRKYGYRGKAYMVR